MIELSGFCCPICGIDVAESIWQKIIKIRDTLPKEKKKLWLMIFADFTGKLSILHLYNLITVIRSAQTQHIENAYYRWRESDMYCYGGTSVIEFLIREEQHEAWKTQNTQVLPRVEKSQKSPR